MPAREFLDTNVLVRAYDLSAPLKKRPAQELVRRAVAGEIVTATQVLAEFAATFLHKMVPAARAEQVTTALDALSPIKLIAPDGSIVRRAVEAQATYGLHFYDGMIVAPAEFAGCERIWSEDLNSGQKYFGVEVVNPFTSRTSA